MNTMVVKAGETCEQREAAAWLARPDVLRQYQMCQRIIDGT